MNSETQTAVELNVQSALTEDIGTGDITAQLIDEDRQAQASIITRENGILCGAEWVNQVFNSLSNQIDIKWAYKDGDKISENTTLLSLGGPARPILTGERCALNFLQCLSGTATTSAYYARLVAHTKVKLLDTRKTLPGLRVAQKYAVQCGGCHNHRIGLFDAFLIKENHILACGSIDKAVRSARKIAQSRQVEVEVESMQEFEQALSAGADTIMLDNFPIAMLKEAVSINDDRAKLEASGGINDDTLVAIAETGVDYISIGALTKNCQSIDLSMRITL